MARLAGLLLLLLLLWLLMTILGTALLLWEWSGLISSAPSDSFSFFLLQDSDQYWFRISNFTKNLQSSLVKAVQSDPSCVYGQDYDDNPECGHSSSVLPVIIITFSDAAISWNHSYLRLPAALCRLLNIEKNSLKTYLGKCNCIMHYLHANPAGEQVPLSYDGIEAGAPAAHA